MKIDLYLLAGFLGSGKTSTLRHILANMPDPQGTMVVVNEAGDFGLDGHLVERYGLPVKELSNGCVCCSLAVDLIGLFRNLLNEPMPPTRVLMEASGLANPVKLRKIVNDFRDSLGIIKTIVLLDTGVWEAREAMGSFFNTQLAVADLLVLNKIDLYSEERIVAMIGEIRSEIPGTHLYPTKHGQVDPDEFWTAPKFSKSIPFIIDDMSMGGYETCTFQSEKTFDENRFKSYIQEVGHNFARIKGQVLLNDGSAYFDYVRGDIAWQAPIFDIKGTLLIFIGKGIDRDHLRNQLEAL